jgi:predicted lipoprotein
VNIQSFPPGAKSLLVQGDGDVTSVDSSSLVGVAHVRFTDAIEADVLVGPVIRGTAIRDALRFIRFSDFANQIEYAQVASSLNERVLDQLRNVPQPALLVGRRVRIVGALATGGSRWEITPLTIDVSGGAK